MLNIFTIVLKGMPFISHHYEQFQRLNIPWKWTIVHGVAAPVNDTAWCKEIESTKDDGTIEYICGLERTDGNIKVLLADKWNGKAAMCNAALETFTEPGLLFQVDSDEVWKAEQIRLFPSLFEMYPTADCAMFMARVWVGHNRYVCTPDGWANRSYEWLRLWKWTPGKKFETHEPPKLEGQNICVLKSHTALLGLVFDHYSYVYRNQIEFKERYYGPQWSVEAWDRLQTIYGPVNLKEVLPFVETDTISYEA